MPIRRILSHVLFPDILRKNQGWGQCTKVVRAPISVQAKAGECTGVPTVHGWVGCDRAEVRSPKPCACRPLWRDQGIVQSRAGVIPQISGGNDALNHACSLYIRARAPEGESRTARPRGSWVWSGRARIAIPRLANRRKSLHESAPAPFSALIPFTARDVCERMGGGDDLSGRSHM
jgi:hypothetical protein